MNRLGPEQHVAAFVLQNDPRELLHVRQPVDLHIRFGCRGQFHHEFHCHGQWKNWFVVDAMFVQIREPARVQRHLGLEHAA